MEKTCSCFDFNYRILADVVEDAIVVCEHDRICFVNSSTVTLCGWSEDELLGMGVEFLLPEYRPRGEGHTQLKARRKDEGEWLATVSTRRIPDASREFTVIAMRDLAHKTLVQGNHKELVVQLTASMASDLSELLSALLINGQAGLEWLSADPPNLSRASRTMESLVRNGKEAADLVTRLRMLISSPQTFSAGDGINEVAGVIDQGRLGVGRSRMLGDGDLLTQARLEPA